MKRILPILGFSEGISFARSLVVGCLLLVILTPLVSNAAVNVIPCGKGVPNTGAGTQPCTFDDLVTLGQNITSFLLKDVAIPFAVILFMWAGFLLMFKSTSAGSMQEAKDIFWSVVVGFVIALAAVLIVKFILFALQAKPELSTRLTFNVVELKR